MPSARTMAFSAALLLTQVSQVSSIMVQYFSAAGCAAADAKSTEYTADDSCLMDGSGKFSKLTCTSSGFTIKKYNDKNCETPCTDSACAETQRPVGQCVEHPIGGQWVKATCGTGQAVKLDRHLFSDSNCTVMTGHAPYYYNVGCTEESEWTGSAWTPMSRKVEVGATTITMGEYDSTDCSGTIKYPSETTCGQCIEQSSGSGTYAKISAPGCPATTVSAGTRSSPLALVAVAVIAYLAR